MESPVVVESTSSLNQQRHIFTFYAETKLFGKVQNPFIFLCIFVLEKGTDRPP